MDDTQYKTINIFTTKCALESLRGHVCQNACVEAKMAWKYAACAYFYSFGDFPRTVGIFSTTRVLQRNLLCSISLCVHILQWGYLWPAWAWHEKHHKAEQGSFWGYFITVHNRTYWICFNVELTLLKNGLSSRNAVRKWADGFYTNYDFFFQFTMYIVSKQLYRIIQD